MVGYFGDHSEVIRKFPDMNFGGFSQDSAFTRSSLMALLDSEWANRLKEDQTLKPKPLKEVFERSVNASSAPMMNYPVTSSSACLKLPSKPGWRMLP